MACRLRKLRKEQQRSLKWMIGQEQEVEEANLRHLGWRAEVRVTRSRQIRGGVLADEVGYGKTATTLVLIDCQAQKAAKSSKAPCVGSISPKATLIIEPRHLESQCHQHSNTLECSAPGKPESSILSGMHRNKETTCTWAPHTAGNIRRKAQASTQQGTTPMWRG